MSDIRPLAQQVATHLVDWPYNEPLSHEQCARLVHHSGARLLLRWSNSGWDRSRLSIDGFYPTTNNANFFPSPIKRITVSATRPPHHIAGDILRRFIPAYIPAFNNADTLQQAYIAKLKRRDGFIDQLATITAGDIDTCGIVNATQGITGQPWGSFEVYLDGTVQVELRNLDLETACELATLVFPR
jgi:hypothetical protein